MKRAAVLGAALSPTPKMGNRCNKNKNNINIIRFRYKGSRSIKDYQGIYSTPFDCLILSESFLPKRMQQPKDHTAPSARSIAMAWQTRSRRPPDRTGVSNLAPRWVFENLSTLHQVWWVKCAEHLRSKSHRPRNPNPANSP